jgi:Kef-type K+ transport system membrane component KefB
MVLAYFIYKEYAPPGINFLSFSLFIGIAMSITAFPVLARILKERNLTRTRIGSMALACAAADDISAWCILAAVISIVNAGSFLSALVTITMILVYVLVMNYVIKPLLQSITQTYAHTQNISLSIATVMFGVLLTSSYLTEIIGIHALFGAFLAGVIMPPDLQFRKMLTGKVEYVALGLLLPLFFAFSGLRTQLALLNTTHAWVICGAITITAILGKFGGSMFAAKFTGESWKNSLIIGALINTRGLMELIVLNIGFELGVLGAELFTMMVIMALVTTFMTGPALDLINYFSKAPKPVQSGTLHR